MCYKGVVLYQCLKLWMSYFYSGDVSKREMEAVSQMREAVQMVEAASLDKEQVQYLLLH